MPRSQSRGPHQPAVLYHFQVAAIPFWEQFAFRRAHNGSKSPARAQINLALSHGPGARAEPLFEMLGVGPRLPDQLWRYIHHALQNKIERGIHRDRVLVTHGRSPSFAVDSQSSRDRKSTRLNSSHVAISYAVFCL